MQSSPEQLVDGGGGVVGGDSTVLGAGFVVPHSLSSAHGNNSNSNSSDQLATLLSQRFHRDVTFAVSSHGSMVVDEEIIRPVTATRRLYGAHEGMNIHLDSVVDISTTS